MKSGFQFHNFFIKVHSVPKTNVFGTFALKCLTFMSKCSKIDLHNFTKVMDMEKKFYNEYKVTQLKFWQNFWEYYKVHVLFAILVIAMVVIGVKSCTGRVENDLSITYFGENAMLTPAKFEIYLDEWSEDVDGDGQATVHITNSPFGAGETGETVTAFLSRIDASLIAGDPFILMTDETYIDRFVNMGALQPLGEIMKGIDIPEEYVKRDANTGEIVAIDLTDLPIGDIVGITSGTKIYMGMKVLPNNKKNNEDYMALHNQVTKIIRNMLEYEN